MKRNIQKNQAIAFWHFTKTPLLRQAATIAFALAESYTNSGEIFCWGTTSGM